MELKTKWVLIALIVLEILLLLGVNHHHNIGDDFAMYLQQSKNIYYGIPQWDNYFIFNSDYIEYAPKVYPIGLPLLLSPIWYFSPNQIIAAKVLLSLCFCLFIFLLFKCGKNEKQGALSIMLFTGICGMIFYIHDVESNILADLFLTISVLGLWILLLIKSDWKKNESILIFIICVISYLLKSVGIYFIFFFAAYFLIKNLEKDGFSGLFRTASLIGLLLLLMHLVNYILGQSGSDLKHFYTIICSNVSLENCYSNVVIYKNELLAVIGTLGTSKTRVLAKFLSYVVTIMFLVGIILDKEYHSRERKLFVLGYLIVIVLFPNFNQGNRYLLPMIPIYFYYAIFPWIRHEWISKKIVYSIFLLCIGLAVVSFHKKEKLEDKIAFTEASYAMYNSIKLKVDAQDRVLCSKPRLVGFMTQRYCGTVNPLETIKKTENFIKREKINTVVTMSLKSNAAIDNYIVNYRNQLELIDSNETHRIYKLLSQY